MKLLRVDSSARRGSISRQLTDTFGADGSKGLLGGKKVVVITARGGAYSPGTPRGQIDFQEPYLRHILGFIGLTDVTFIHAENRMRADLAGADRPTNERTSHE